MKNTITIIALLLTLSSQAQLQASMRSGYSAKSNDLFVAPALNYAFGPVTLTTELMTNIKQDAPENFGLLASYQYKFIEAGYGIWYILYSMDNDKMAEKNQWSPGYFISAHYEIAFIKAEYLKEFKISLGVRTTIFK